MLTHLGPDGPMHVAWVERTAPGVSVVDDWDGMGQRTTASGAVRLVDVEVDDSRITPYALTFEGPQTFGAFAQVLHAALDAGIARAALDEAAEFVTTKSRPYPDAEVDRHADDPLVVRAFGEMELAVRGAEALVREAARAVDRADRALTAQSAGAASLAVAAARAATTQAAVDVTTRLFEVVRDQVGAGQPQPAPALAQRPDPHAPRPGGVEGAAPRSLRPRRHAAAPARTAVSR